MNAFWLKRGSLAAALVAAMAVAGCGDFVRQSRSPSQLVIVRILTVAGTGSVPDTGFVSGPLLSDVAAPGQTTFDDFGQVTLRAMRRDPLHPAAASDINDVTVTRYRVTYRRSDGRNTPGIDVPRAFDGAVTVTLGVGDEVDAVFELVRHVAKLEAPLAVLGTSPVVLTTIADVTFFGRDQAGNDLSVTGNVQINFANFN